MYLGLDIGRQYVKMVTVEKSRDEYKILDAGSRLVTALNATYDPEKIDHTHRVMAVKELLRQQDLIPKRVKSVISGINGSSSSISSIISRVVYFAVSLLYSLFCHSSFLLGLFFCFIIHFFPTLFCFIKFVK